MVIALEVTRRDMDRNDTWCAEFRTREDALAYGEQIREEAPGKVAFTLKEGEQ